MRLLILCIVALATPSPIVASAQTAAVAKVAKYEATITKKDDKNNTRTFKDYCDAASNSEATRIFKERHPGATVSGVRESK